MLDPAVAVAFFDVVLVVIVVAVGVVADAAVRCLFFVVVDIAVVVRLLLLLKAKLFIEKALEHSNTNPKTQFVTPICTI